MTGKDVAKHSLEEKLGQVYTPAELAEYLKVDEDTVRKYYRRMGGIRLGRRILFFDKLIERSINDAILQQEKEAMDSVCHKERDKETSDICNKEGSSGIRGEVAKIPTKQVAGRDLYGLLN